ncbi:Cytochrome P450 [Mycena venus]|uniref:Cytochrome P450 n=1 Tax=Mycena venus TaxID=2733690 RepID=A0A8H6YD30_9AGAR|nr:Cytochrome P450 [Mycena venus]
MKWSTGRMFSFKVLSDTVIVVRGFTGRDIFLAKGLDFLAGYKLLVPQLKEFLPLKPLTGDESWGAVMASFICTRMIEKFHGTMLGAIAAGYDAWGDEGTLDLFRSVNEIIFAVSLPLAGCQHFAKDAEAIRTLIDIFARLDAGSGPSSLILPWVPTPARVNRVLAGLQLYRITKNLVQERQRLGVDVDDPLQTLIRQNYPTSEMARFIATILFASVTNTANLFAWTLVYLELHKEWKDRVNSEVTTFLQDTGLHASQNLRDDMAYVPLSLMDEKLHTIELVINEVLRLLASGPFIRRNIGDDLVVDGVHIPKGAFIMFPVEDLHRNPKMFPNPDVFDPTRFTAENVEQRKKYGTTFLGWGGGRHPCVGKRTALLEIKMMTILLMAQYQFSLTDVTDSPLCEIPRVDVDRLFKVFGSKEVVNIRYRAKDR